MKTKQDKQVCTLVKRKRHNTQFLHIKVATYCTQKLWETSSTACSEEEKKGLWTFLMAYLGSSGMTRRIFPSQNSATTRSFFQPWKHNTEKKLQLQANNSEQTRPPCQTNSCQQPWQQISAKYQTSSNKNKSHSHFSGKWTKETERTVSGTS